MRLQINYNSTHRAAWYCRLGFQRLQGPLEISLRSISNNGGGIGCVKVYIARIYPMTYMERLDYSVVWRNERSEQRKRNEWELKRGQLMEVIQQELENEYEKEMEERNVKWKSGKWTQKDLEGVSCPRSLYEMMESSMDPESFRVSENY